MSGGLTSYPRTEGGGGPHLRRFYKSLALVREGGSAAEAAAKAVIDELRSLTHDDVPRETIIAAAIEARDTLFIALERGDLAGPRYVEVMAICAEHWVELNPIDTTALAADLQSAINKLDWARSYGTAQERRRASELLGTIATRYHASALLGRDLAREIGPKISAVSGHPRYSVVYDESGRLIWFEASASYNPNFFFRESIPGADNPLILTAEGKGGSSGYGHARFTKPMKKRFSAQNQKSTTVKQNTLAYVVTRAYYCEKSGENTRACPARAIVGREIMDAYKPERLVFFAARGRLLELEGKLKFIHKMEAVSAK